MAARPTSARPRPECIVLGPRRSLPPSSKPPVRLFVGTEPAQYRAERILVWSVERCRDPSRSYEIHLMKGLPGFDRSAWTTGFTNYRFAIPELAGSTGLAIYNDVDQIYLADPAELFDTPMDGCGYRAIAADDSSVMLIDCARMVPLWNLEAAASAEKGQLLERARNLYGALASEWNARDGEFSAGRSKLLHYTTLHTQPWRPFPRRFVYQQGVRADLWHDLERSADAAGFQVFSREGPSARYGSELSGSDVRELAHTLERVPDDDVAWVLDEIARSGDGAVKVAAECAPGSAAHHGADWWTERFQAAAARHPDLHWELALRPAGRTSAAQFRIAGRHPGPGVPSVWVLADDRPGNATQSLGLADALGWPTEVKPLRCGPLSRLHNRLLGASVRGIEPGSSASLAPPWPDLVIAAGRRTAPVAGWIREQSRGRTRIVQLGRKGGDAADLFDLVATPSYCRLFPHPQRIETTAPLHRVSQARLAEAVPRWIDRIEGAREPRIAVLVGGTSGQYRLDVRTARLLGEDVTRMARACGGSLLATTSRRLSLAATDAFCAGLEDPHLVHRWEPGSSENPYLGLLALADAFVITGDSESMLAEATSLGRPVYVYPLRERATFRLLRFFRERVVTRATACPAGPRGTPRPQQGLERLCARLIDRGWVRPSRDLDLLHQELFRRGVAKPFGAAPTALAGVEGEPLRDRERVADRVRELMGVPKP